MYLYHYYDLNDGAFKNLSDLTIIDAKELLSKIKLERPNALASARHERYIETRLGYEDMARRLFEEKGGKISRKAPHYMVVEACPWLYSWFENPAYIRIPIKEFDLSTISFTYGDMHPTFSPKVNDGKEYRKQLYLYDEIIKLIDKYGLPQEWNADGMYGPERYIEVQVWSDVIISRFLK